MEDDTSILELSFQMGETLLKNGAEISRVQETMERVARAYHAEEFNVYVLTNAIFATGVEQGVERSVELKHIPSTSTHLGRISAVNQLSREIAQGQHTVEEAFQILRRIQALPFSSLPLATRHPGLRGGQRRLQLPVRRGPVRRLHRLCVRPGAGAVPVLGGQARPLQILTNLSASALVTLCGGVVPVFGLWPQHGQDHHRLYHPPGAGGGPDHLHPGLF